jgi:pimeloyl-ACP methyl ester carboxylesterase
MPRAVVNKWETLPIEVEFDTFGSATNPALLLIMGFGAQMVAWDAEFVQMLADRGLFVIRFDNRDCGLTTKLDGVEVDAGAVVAAALTEQPMPPVPYTPFLTWRPMRLVCLTTSASPKPTSWARRWAA